MGDYHDFKAMEADRIQPLLGAISALPGAALVLGTGASPGAPLLVVALAFAAAAYLHWMCSDAAFAIAHDHYAANDEVGAKPSEGIGYYFSWSTTCYGAASLASTIMGFVGIHSQLRLPIAVETGFLISMAIVLAVIVHCIHSVYLRNKVLG